MGAKISASEWTETVVAYLSDCESHCPLDEVLPGVQRRSLPELCEPGEQRVSLLQRIHRRLEHGPLADAEVAEAAAEGGNVAAWRKVLRA